MNFLHKYNGLLDVFSVPISIFPTKRKKYHGSIPGLALTIFLIVCVLGFIYYKLFKRMVILKDDTYASQNIFNDFSDQYNDFSLQEFHFLPSFVIDLLDDSDTNIAKLDAKTAENQDYFDIWEGNTRNLDFDKL